MYLSLSLYIYIHVFVCILSYMYIYIYIYIYIYKYTHNRTSIMLCMYTRVIVLQLLYSRLDVQVSRFASSQKRGFCKGAFSNNDIIITRQLLNPPLLNPPL